jgi:DNA-binding TFAR19-related protein (PDSD5 family)
MCADKHPLPTKTERGVREQRQAALSVELEREANLRAKGHALVRQQLADEVAPLRVRIEAEETGRKAVDAELLAAVQHYAAALQDCIRRVSLS